MPEKTVFVSRKRSRGRHAWVFSNEVQRTEGDPGLGDVVRVYDRQKFLGSGIYNPNSLIRIRLYSDEDEDLDLPFLKKRLRAAWQYRLTQLPGETDFRLVYGESDGVPGLVVDKYGQHFVLQTYAAGMDQRKEIAVQALVETFEVHSVYEKNDFRLREAEGLERREGLLYGQPEERVVIKENGAKFYVDFTHGQKTGYYYDQRVTRRKVRELARGRRFLDVFCYTGGFAVNAALGGAREVVAVDGSVPAANLAAANAELNGVSDRCRFVVAEAFTYLAELGQKGERFDLVCLDPPAFIKSQKEKERGIKGFRTINTLAMKLLSPGGILVTCSCSHYLFWQDMFDMLALAAQDSGRGFVVMDRVTQGPDHPVLLAMRESEYLRCFILRVS
ncbi:MAG: class I SAM-dependent rRNA methyltransferase [candidate division WOR-3 bacterium]